MLKRFGWLAALFLLLLLGVPEIEAEDLPNLIIDQHRLAVQWHLEKRTFPENSCAVLEGCVEKGGTRLLLRFTIATPNVGTANLEIGSPFDSDLFAFDPCHGHHHFLEYSDYRLWTPGGYMNWIEFRAEHEDEIPGDIIEHPDLREKPVVGGKQGFCVIDVVPYAAAPELLQPPNFQFCSFQGLTVGWADVYDTTLPCQWIDVTDISPGEYVLEVEVNPERLFLESDYMDNAAAIKIVVPDRPGRAPKP